MASDSASRHSLRSFSLEADTSEESTVTEDADYSSRQSFRSLSLETTASQSPTVTDDTELSTEPPTPSQSDYESAAQEKSRLEQETLSHLEEEKSRRPRTSNGVPQRSTVPVSEEDNEVDWDSPPPYEQLLGNDQRNVSTSVLDNGRISMMFRGQGYDFTNLPNLPEYELEPVTTPDAQSYPLLNIVIQVVGSRGDVQPFIALGQELKEIGHRVRIATHENFEEFVREAGLEFFSIGGDPTVLMAYMVKNPGIIPKFETLRAGDIARKRKMVSEILEGCWNSCIQPDPISGTPFVAEAIIANPPSFAHIHCAQALAIPVHLMFTMPWSATRTFPHPLANVQRTDTDSKTTNFLSYGLVDMMTWQGLGAVVNQWRRSTLNLESLPTMVGANLASYLKVPFTYCWSPALIAKPFDWPSHIDVCGFFFRSQPEYEPSPELSEFLEAGAPPIYIGFGSIVMQDSHGMTRLILDAIRQCGVRAIISRGWTGLGNDIIENHPDVLFIGDCPHEWLFKQVSAVIHHGGSGTTACGLLNGRPTAIIPFFGDQPFWGNMVAAAGAGPRPIDLKNLSVTTLSNTIRFLLHPSTIQSASQLATKMQHENGVKEAVKSFHRNLPIELLKCDMLPRHPATWCWKRGKRTLRLSHRAASVLVENKKIEASSLRIYKPKPISIENRRWDPITGTTSAFLESMYNIGDAMGDMVEYPLKEYRKAKTISRQNTIASSSSTSSITPPTTSSSDTQNILTNNSNSSSATLTQTQTQTRTFTPSTSSSIPAQKVPSANKAAATAARKSVGKVGMAITKGAIDLPVAMADGLRNMPALYGDKVREYGEIRGWKSGAVVGAKNLGYGYYDACAGFFTQPYRGAKEAGVGGFMKGLAKGSMGLITKPDYTMLGIVAYPALGLYKQLNTTSLTGAQGSILKAQKEYGIYLASTMVVDKDEEEVKYVLRTFDEEWLRVRE